MRTNLLLHPLTARHRRRPNTHRRPASEPAGEGDIVVRRNREAGGPCDEACYVCTCGFTFDASVSTSVRCPHCGRTQAW